MDIVEIILLVVGGIIFVLSFLIPDRKDTGGGTGGLTEEGLKILVDRELQSIRGYVDEVVEEAVTYAVEKTERSLERLSNEKIMAVSEYSDTVLSEIHKNHEEAMFLYDMLNNKQVSLKNTVSEINRTVKEAEDTMTSFQRLVPEVSVPTEKTLEERAPVDRAAADKVLAELGVWQENTSKEPPAFNENGFVGEELSALEERQELLGIQGQVEELPVRTNNNDSILELYGQGKSTVAIAKELGLGIGEVKLVIDLFKNQNRGIK